MTTYKFHSLTGELSCYIFPKSLSLPGLATALMGCVDSVSQTERGRRFTEAIPELAPDKKDSLLDPKNDSTCEILERHTPTGFCHYQVKVFSRLGEKFFRGGLLSFLGKYCPEQDPRNPVAVLTSPDWGGYFTHRASLEKIARLAGRLAAQDCPKSQDLRQLRELASVMHRESLLPRVEDIIAHPEDKSLRERFDFTVDNMLAQVQHQTRVYLKEV